MKTIIFIVSCLVGMTQLQAQSLVGRSHVASGGNMVKYIIPLKQSFDITTQKNALLSIGLSTMDVSGRRYFTFKRSINADTLWNLNVVDHTLTTELLPNYSFTCLEYADNKIYSYGKKGFWYYDLQSHDIVNVDTVHYLKETISTISSTFDSKGKRLFYINSISSINDPDTICMYDFKTLTLTKTPIPLPHRKWLCMEYSTKNDKIYCADTLGIQSFNITSQAFTTVNTDFKEPLESCMLGISSFDSARNVYIVLKQSNNGNPDTAVYYKIDQDEVVKKAVPLGFLNMEYTHTDTCLKTDSLWASFNGDVTMNWTEVEDASYEYSYSVAPAPSPSPGVPVSSTSVTLPGLKPATKYEFCVRAVCGSNYSEWVCKTFYSLGNGISVYGKMPGHIDVYPNPAGEFVYLDLPGNAAIDIRDMMGRSCKKMTGVKKDDRIDISGFAPGLYTLTAITEERTYTASFVKE